MSAKRTPNYQEDKTISVKVTLTPCEMDVIKKFHTQHQINNYQRYLTKSKEELVQEFLREQNEKNIAHYFIMEKGLIEEFEEYCSNS